VRVMSYKHYAVLVLMFILAFSYVDRTALAVVTQSIEDDLRLSDTQLGLLTGVGFALFASLMAVPIARWADRGNRVAVVSLTTAAWSVAVALSGLASGFVSLLLARSVVASGEGGCEPLAGSMIPDLFSRSERPRAMGRYYIGISLGLMAGYFVGGWLNEWYGWRNTFIAIGAGGMPLVLLARLTLREPRRMRGDPPGNTHASLPRRTTLRAVIGCVGAIPAFRQLLLFCLIWFFSGWAITYWLPTFFIRSHHMATGVLGTGLAVVYGVSGLVGAWLGGEWSSRVAPKNERLQLRVAAWLMVADGIFYSAALMVPNETLALSAVAIANLAETSAFGSIFATLQTIVPNDMRATAQALVKLLPSFIGAGFGPMTAGALSDMLRSWVGAESIRVALLALCVGYLWAAYHLWRSSSTVMRDIAAAQNEGSPDSACPQSMLIALESNR